VQGFSAYFAQANVGKRNVCVDLKVPGGPEVVARLAGAADVLIENFRPGVLSRFGLGADTLMAADPRLVYCSVTGWGQSGPWKDRRSYAPLAHAGVGTMELVARRRGRRRPELEVNQHADVYAALLAANAVLAALLQRTVTGRGQHLDVALGDAGVYVNEWAAADLQPPDEFAGFDTWHQYSYRLGDGSYAAILGNPVVSFEHWMRQLGGEPDVLADPRFATPEARARHLPELLDAIDVMTSRFDTFEDLEAAAGPLMMAGHVRSLVELAGTEWARERGLFTEVIAGLPVPAAPWRSSDASVGARAIVSALGADSRAVLAECGFGPGEVEKLVACGAVREGSDR
jgi:crotonobetainyl-CoA:carnitine CoA-transferase CaiB-like acyl-CoA transferase